MIPVPGNSIAGFRRRRSLGRMSRYSPGCGALVIGLFLGWAGEPMEGRAATNDGPKVSQRDGAWWIEGSRQKVRFTDETLAMDIESSATRWKLGDSAPGDLSVRVHGERAALQLSHAGSRSITPYGTGYAAGLKVALGSYRLGDRVLDLEVQMLITLDGVAEDLECEILATDGAATIQELRWPGALNEASFDYTAVPFMQGMLLPRAWPSKVHLYDTLCFGRGLYQPWWGWQQGGRSMVAILETAEDGACHFEHPAGGPTRMGVRWVSSLGRWSYPRRMRFSFLEGDYVAMAKRYRQQAKATGRLVTLREKIARNPAVAELVGTPVIHTSILYHIQPESSYFNKTNTEVNHQLVTFDARAAELRRLPDLGVGQAYVHLDGWGARGYDNLHPDVLPPSQEAGGWEGMKRFADACADLGFIFAIHDQYRDYYLDAPSYDERHTLIEEGGKRPLHATWYGGRQSILCQRLAPGFVRRNHQSILAHGVKIRGAYLDVFSVVPGDECQSTEHPVTRAESLRYRGECLDSVRAWGGVVSSEEPSDWSVPHLDLVHHGPYPLDPNPGGGPAMGIPVPLFNLVYHDALLIPWSLGRGAWGIPRQDLGFLHGLGNAGLPYVSLAPDPTELSQVRTLRALHRRVGLRELRGHRLLDASGRKQEFEYDEGTRVRIDLDTDAWSVKPELRVDE
jgi:hypothetical protein